MPKRSAYSIKLTNPTAKEVTGANGAASWTTTPPMMMTTEARKQP